MYIRNILIGLTRDLFSRNTLPYPIDGNGVSLTTTGWYIDCLIEREFSTSSLAESLSSFNFVDYDYILSNNPAFCWYTCKALLTSL